MLENKDRQEEKEFIGQNLDNALPLVIRRRCEPTLRAINIDKAIYVLLKAGDFI